jgi:hypothetical protein
MPKFICTFTNDRGNRWEVAVEAADDPEARAEACRIAPLGFILDGQPRPVGDAEFLEARRLTEAQTIQASHTASRSHLKLVQ